MNSTAILIPAYGKSYNTKYEIMKDWRNGEDFKIVNGSYCSTRDMQALTSDYDRVILHWINERGMGKSVTLWEHLLAGITNYV
jgi:hypothetical protein